MNKKLLLVLGIILLLAAAALVLMLKKKPEPFLNKTLSRASNISGTSAIKENKPVSYSTVYNKAVGLETRGDLEAAKSAYAELINEFPNSAEVMNWQKKIEEINIKLLYSGALTAKSQLYEIKPGDSIFKIAKNFKTTSELIKKSNNLNSDLILPGKKIKVWTAPFTILVDKSQNTLILKSDEEIIKTYTVSTGINNSSPGGTFKIVNKLVNPSWFKAGAVVETGSPENILGSRWLGFDLPGYGIHGTTDPQSLGKQVTQGCVRMSNADAEELYTIVPSGTEVTIVD